MSTEAVVAKAPVVESAPNADADPVQTSPTKSAEPANHVSGAGGDEPVAKKAKTGTEENGEVKEKTPKKKVSQLERTRAEAEALIGDLKKEGAESGGRRTRSQTRGTPAKSVVPEKPARSPRTPKPKSESPAAAPKKTPVAGARSRGRPAKKAAAAADEENGASAAAAGEAVDAVSDAADDVKSADVTEKAEPVIAENGQKSSDSEQSKADTESETKAKKEAEPESQKVTEKVAEPASESVEKTADPSPVTASSAAAE